MAQTEKGIVYPYDYNEVADVPSDFKALAESIDRILSDYSLNTESGNKIVLEMNNTTYKIKAVLKDKDDNVIDTSNEIDLPLENMVTNISYNNQILTLTHQDGQTTKVSIADLISDLASKEDVSELQSQVDDLTTLVETELESNEVEGTEIDVSDSAEYRGKIEVKGNTEQEQLSGNQLVDFIDLTVSNNSTTYTFTNDILEIIANGYSYNYIYKFITDLVKSNPGKTLKFTYNSIDVSSQFGHVAQLRIVYNDGTPTVYTQLLRNNLENIPYVIPNDTSNIESVRFEVYSNNTSTTQSSSVTITKPMLQFGTEDKDYEPYCGGQAAPNPSYEIPIKVVTGDNVVKHRGKNMFDVDSLSFKNGYYDATGAYRTGNNNGIFEFIKVLQNSDYTLSVNKAFSFIAINEFDENKNFIKRTQIQKGRIATITTDVNTMYLAISFNLDSTTTITKLLLKDFEPQLEEGTTPTPYEPYREEEYRLDLVGKNKFNKNDFKLFNGYISGTPKTVRSNSNGYLIYMKCKPNKTYTVSRVVLENNFAVASGEVIPYAGQSINNYVANTSAEQLTIQTASNHNYLYIYLHYEGDSEYTIEQLIDKLQVEEGQIATDYTPYNSLELCKIGDYEDIEVGDENYNAELENGAFFKHKKISKFIFDGNNTDVYELNSDNNNTIGINIKPNGIDQVAFRFFGTKISAYSDKLAFLGNVNDIEHIYITAAVQNVNGYFGNCRLYIDKSRLDGYDASLTTAQKINLVKNWLKSNPITAYVILKEPVYEKITDPTLISQLEALRKAKWYKGVNHWWTETENLEPNLKGTYKQSNNLRLQALEQAVVALGGV